MADPDGASVLRLADERFVSLTTYRRNGEAVATPVWIAGDGSSLVVTTGSASGKVKRLRRTPGVTLRPCDRRGRVRPGAVAAQGRAEILEDPASFAAGTSVIRKKYAAEFRVVMLVERILSRGRRDRVILRIHDV